MGLIVENQDAERSPSFYVLRFVKISRVFLFASGIAIQTYLSLITTSVYYLPSITAACFIILMDLVMYNKRKDQFKEFYLVSVIILLLSNDKIHTEILSCTDGIYKNLCFQETAIFGREIMAK